MLPSAWFRSPPDASLTRLHGPDWPVFAWALALGACSSQRAVDDGSIDSGAPTLLVLPAIHDFGIVNEGEVLKHVFQVTNPGTAPLHITSIDAPCGCTVPAMVTRTIPPHGVTDLNVSVDTTGRSGPFQADVRISSNASPTAPAVVAITANVEHLLAFESRGVRLVTKYGVRHVHQARLVGKLAAQARPHLLEVTEERLPSAPQLTTRVIAKEGTAGALELTLAATQPASGSALVVVATGLVHPERLEFVASWTVAGTLRIEPGELVFNSGHPAGKERELQVSSGRPGFVLRSVEVVDGLFTASLRQTTPGRFLVLVSWQGPRLPVERETTVGHLLLNSNDRLEPRRIVELRMSRPPAPIPPPPRPR